MTIGERIRNKRRSRGMSVDELAHAIGKHRATVYRYENGDIENMPVQDLMPIANALRTTPAFLMGWEEDEVPEGFEPLPETNDLPVIGQVACGEPILAEENVEGYFQVPLSARADFVLVCKGDSMTDVRIHDGDLAFIRKQPVVENGQIAAVRIGEECTLKRFQRTGDTIILLPCNPAYQPMIFQGREAEDVHIEGLLVGIMSLKV